MSSANAGGKNVMSGQLYMYILEPMKTGKVSTKTHVAETVPASYTLPLQMVPDPLAT